MPILLAGESEQISESFVYAALDAIDPDFLLIGDRMRAYLAQAEGGEISLAIEDWLEARGAENLYEVDDPAYGLFEVFEVSR